MKKWLGRLAHERRARALRTLRHTLAVGDGVDWHEHGSPCHGCVVNVRVYVHGTTEFLTSHDDTWRPVTVITGGRGV